MALVVLAAHEIRKQVAREKFFLELKRITADGGKVVVVEHLQDVFAAFAFGPAGLFHFLPRVEWLRLGKFAGLNFEREFAITPFVRVFVFNK